VETRGHGLVPGRNPTWNRPGNLDLFLTLQHREFPELLNLQNTSFDRFRYLLAVGKPMKRLSLVISQGK